MADTSLELSGDLDASQPLTTPSDRRWMALSFSNISAREWIQKRREGVQPWAEFLNFNKFKIPKTVAPVGKRIVKNIERFQSNYIFIFAILVIFCILTSPLLLVAIAACFGACYIISLRNSENKLAIMGKEISVTHQYAGIGLLAFPLFWLAGAGSAVFWVIGASFFVIMLHASLYKLSDEDSAFETVDLETV